MGLSEEQAIEQAKGDILVFTSTFTPMKNTVSGYVRHCEVLLFGLLHMSIQTLTENYNCSFIGLDCDAP